MPLAAARRVDGPGTSDDVPNRHRRGRVTARYGSVFEVRVGDDRLQWTVSTDRVGRYGGEEFLLVLPETDLQQAGVLAEKIRVLVERAATLTEDGAVVQATVSIGLASLEQVAKEGSGSARELIAAVDRSLYSAKHLGRNRVHPEVANFDEIACSA